MRGLEGKCALVSGAGRGIGAAVVRRLLDEGCKVVGLDIEPIDPAPHAGKPFVALRGDVAVEATWDAAAQAAAEAFGPVDLLVNNAGVLGPRQPIHRMDPAEFDRVVAVNFRGVFLGLRRVIGDMLAADRAGAIVNLSSIGGVRPGLNSTAYGTTKRAVIHLTQVAALEAGPKIRVNAICPGPIDTPMLHAAYAPAALAERVGKTPLQRVANPSEVASLIAFLLSDEASFQTGGVYPVDGGMGI